MSSSIGLAPCCAAVDTVIYFLVGSEAPFALRKSSDAEGTFVIVGEHRGCGLTEGEVIQESRTGPVKLETLTIV